MEPQCQFYVMRKKRLCRMTVRSGRQYCGEHEPQPVTDDGQVRTVNGDTRIPCPNDPKHTCYASKLQKHLSICNARNHEDPEYIQRDVNAPPHVDLCIRLSLNKYSSEKILKVIDKVNYLYDEYVDGKIESIPEQPIHGTVLEEFNNPGRTESSLRHLRQASSILHLIEKEGLVCDRNCYVELGAGKGQLSWYACQAWCNTTNGSSVLLIDRASLRHKRDNKLRSQPGVAYRLRADLAHLVLARAPGVLHSDAVVGLAKHLCGVATDYALRCAVGGAESKTKGLVMATCCHHRCEINAYVGELADLGITSEEFNIMLGVVSWATCGDGRARTHITRTDTVSSQDKTNQQPKVNDDRGNNIDNSDRPTPNEIEASSQVKDIGKTNDTSINMQGDDHKQNINLDIKYKEKVGRRAKALLDWGRVLFLKKHGFQARLCYFVPQTVSLENVCIIATKLT